MFGFHADVVCVCVRIGFFYIQGPCHLRNNRMKKNTYLWIPKYKTKHNKMECFEMWFMLFRKIAHLFIYLSDVLKMIKLCDVISNRVNLNF